MKIFISADMEGIGGVVSYEQIDYQKKAYLEAQKQMIKEINAVIDGAFAGGAAQVLVNDAHDTMTNLLPGMIDSRASLISGAGKPLSMMQGIEGADAAMFIGYHARAGTRKAILDHTYSGKIYKLMVNGREMGETGFNAAIAGHFSVPVLAVSGDRALCAEAKEINPLTETFIVKDAIGRTAADCLPLDQCCFMFRKGIKKCLQNYIAGAIKTMPCREVLPVIITVELITTQMADLAEIIPGVKRIDGRTVKAVGEDMLRAAGYFFSILRLTGGYADKLI